MRPCSYLGYFSRKIPATTVKFGHAAISAISVMTLQLFALNLLLRPLFVLSQSVWPCRQEILTILSQHLVIQPVQPGTSCGQKILAIPSHYSVIRPVQSRDSSFLSRYGSENRRFQLSSAKFWSCSQHNQKILSQSSVIMRPCVRSLE